MSFSCFCQEVHFKVFQCSYRESSWSSWTPWNTCNADLTIDLEKIKSLYQVKKHKYIRCVRMMKNLILEGKELYKFQYKIVEKFR